MVELQGILLHSLHQLAITFPGLLLGLTVFLYTCLVPFLNSIAQVLSALRRVSSEGRKLVQDGQEWRRVLKTPFSSKSDR